MANNRKYFKSKDIKVYPTSRRGNYISEAKSYTFDPEARLDTEYNKVNGFTKTVAKSSYVVSFNATSGILKCVIGGYYFEISNIGENGYTFETLALDANAKISLINNELDARNTYLLKSQEEATPTKLDTILSNESEAVFTGLVMDPADPSEFTDVLNVFDDNSSLLYESQLLESVLSLGQGNGSLNQTWGLKLDPEDANITEGEYSITFGKKNQNKGDFSLVYGKNIINNGDNNVLIGSNIEITDTDANNKFIVGNFDTMSLDSTDEININNFIRVNTDTLTLNKGTNRSEPFFTANKDSVQFYNADNTSVLSISNDSNYSTMNFIGKVTLGSLDNMLAIDVAGDDEGISIITDKLSIKSSNSGSDCAATVTGTIHVTNAISIGNSSSSPAVAISNDGTINANNTISTSGTVSASNLAVSSTATIAGMQVGNGEVNIGTNVFKASGYSINYDSDRDCLIITC